jgi:hypothetical protein
MSSRAALCVVDVAFADTERADVLALAVDPDLCGTTESATVQTLLGKIEYFNEQKTWGRIAVDLQPRSLSVRAWCETEPDFWCDVCLGLARAVASLGADGEATACIVHDHLETDPATRLTLAAGTITEVELDEDDTQSWYESLADDIQRS